MRRFCLDFLNNKNNELKGTREAGFLTTARRNPPSLDASPVEGKRAREEFLGARLGEAGTKRVCCERWEEPDNFRRRHQESQWNVVCL
jgi:hypothetical protein